VRDLPPPYARALLFDVDGVLTDRYARPDVAVLRQLAAELSRGAAVGLITGRSRSWLAANILELLSELVSDARVGARLALACEFGALYGRGVLTDMWAVAGPCVPRALAQAVHERVQAFSDLLEWDATKECIATFEARHAQAKRRGQGAVAAALSGFQGAIEPLLAAADCTARLSTYTLDVLPAALSKRVGARRVIDLLREDANLESAVVLGDSPGDVEIAEQALAEGLRDVEFVWLGEGDQPLLPPPVRLVRPRRPYSRGALLYLRSMRAA
jgi:phosphoglycolate phosphatase-like HAD superfamily hydrolase